MATKDQLLGKVSCTAQHSRPPQTKSPVWSRDSRERVQLAGYLPRLPSGLSRLSVLAETIHQRLYVHGVFLLHREEAFQQTPGDGALDISDVPSTCAVSAISSDAIGYTDVGRSMLRPPEDAGADLDRG